MNNKFDYYKQIVVADKEYDVAVIGGGSAGICAAIAAARLNASVLLIENTGWLGGIGTTAAMVEFGPIVRGGLRVVGGIPYELMQRMKEYGGAELRDETEDLCFAPESFAHTALEMCEEAGVEFLLHTRFIDSILQDGKISAIVVDNKEGLQLIKAKVFMDCTGDGDVFARAGLPFHIGRDIDGKTQPMTLVFFVNNVNYKHFLEVVAKEAEGDLDVYFTRLVSKARADGNFHIPIVRPGSTGPVPRCGRKHDLSNCEVFVNGTNIVGKCGVNAKDLTEAECITRKQVKEMFAFLKKYAPGFENCYISLVPSEIGVRETRRLDGVYVLTAEDLASGRKFEDTIAVGFNMIDIHQVAGEDFDLTHFADGHYYSVPYRCLLPKTIANLLVTGRCISVTHEALGAVRVMVNTMPIAEAAGYAAAMSAQKGCSVQNVPIDALQNTLKERGAVLGF